MPMIYEACTVKWHGSTYEDVVMHQQRWKARTVRIRNRLMFAASPAALLGVLNAAAAGEVKRWANLEGATLQGSTAYRAPTG